MAQPLHTSLLRPPILHILRAAGFTATRPSVVDTLADLASRYLLLLASNASRHALLHNPDLPPDSITITDVRLALQDAGALHPQMSEMEEQVLGTEDLRGVESFIAWCKSDVNTEIRRIAGLAPDKTDGAAVETELQGQREDFLQMLKKKHSKTGEESRYQGTALGKDIRERVITIEGGEVGCIRDWDARLRKRGKPREEKRGEVAERSEGSTPLSEISGLS